MRAWRRATVLAFPWCLAAAATAIALTGTGSAASAADPAAVVLEQGDEVRVAGAPIGCRATTRNGHPALDCRRGGRLRGTYGTLLTDRRAMMVRFRSARVADIVVSARHRGKAHRCGDRVQVARAARR